MPNATTRSAVAAFLAGVPGKFGKNTEVYLDRDTKMTSLLLHGNVIAEFRDHKLWITDSNWQTHTTKERLNGLPGVQIYQKNWEWFLNDSPWDGSWVQVT